MKLQNKKQILRGILLFIGVIIIALSLFYLYNYLDNDYYNKHNNIEGFLTTQNIYQPYYTGEPTNTTTNNLPVLTSTQTYYLNGLQAIATNNKKIYALLQNSAGQTLISYYNTTSTPNAWVNLALATNSSATAANVINKINPSITNPKYDTSTIIQCYSTNGLILKANQTTVFYYNGGTNNSDNIDCLYYMNLNNDGSISSNGSATLNCLKLPILVQSRILPTSSGSISPSMNFDKLKLIATNQNILFALGCSDGNNGNNNLYYCILNNGAPPSNNSNNWKSYQISKANCTINNICVNDNCIFIYYFHTSPNSTTTNIIIYYSPIQITNSVLTLNLQPFGDSSDTSSPLFGNSVIFNNIAVNNNVIWSIDSYNKKLWWFALQNGIPAPGTLNYKWQSYDITSLDTSGNSFPIISGILDMILYKNTLVVFGSTNNLIIPLYNSSSTSSTTTPNPTGTGTTTPNPTGTGTTTPNPTGTGTTTPNPTGTGYTIITTYPNTTNITRAQGAETITPYNPVQALLSEMDLSNFFGNYNSASNLYISPMNNSNLYNPTNANRNARIDSAFFPIVKLN